LVDNKVHKTIHIELHVAILFVGVAGLYEKEFTHIRITYRLRRIENRPWGGLVIAMDVASTTTSTGVRWMFAAFVMRSLGVIPACTDS
jgi:hypothetical protein